GSCFPKDTLIKMMNGSLKPIQDIKIGDEIMMDGLVESTIHNHGKYRLSDYLGVRVSGGHAVFEAKEFIRVKDSINAIETDEYEETVYNLVTENHAILINNIMFADYDETDDLSLSNDESLKVLNSNVHVC